MAFAKMVWCVDVHVDLLRNSMEASNKFEAFHFVSEIQLNQSSIKQFEWKKGYRKEHILCLLL